MTKEQYDDLSAEQNHECAICNSPLSKGGKKLSVDHCHTTLLIRGLLCNKCNFGLGYFDDDVNKLHKAINYLTNNLSYKGIKYKK